MANTCGNSNVTNQLFDAYFTAPAMRTVFSDAGRLQGSARGAGLREGVRLEPQLRPELRRVHAPFPQ